MRAVVEKSHITNATLPNLQLPTIYTLLPAPQSTKSESDEGKKTLEKKRFCPIKFVWLTAPFGMEEKRGFTRWLFEVLQQKLNAGKLIPSPPLLIKGGLASLREALEAMGSVSAQKVVVTLDE